MNEQNTLIDKLEREYKELDRLSDYDHSLDDVVSGFHKAIKIVKHHQGESVWVSVGEGLPTENEIVLVYRQGFGVMGIAKYSANVFWYFDLNGGKNNFISMSGVTHYKPLPSPPSEVQDDGKI